MSKTDGELKLESVNTAIERLTRMALDPSGKCATVDLDDLRHVLSEVLRLRTVALDHTAHLARAGSTITNLKHASDGLLTATRTFHNEAQHGTPSAHAMRVMIDAADAVDRLLRKVGRT